MTYQIGDKRPTMSEMRPEDRRQVDKAFLQLAKEWQGADQATIADMVLEAWSPNAVSGALIYRVKQNIVYVTV